MNAADKMRARRRPVRLVIFDCDGVLVDSERLSSRVLAEDLSARGWPLSAEEAEHLFIGTSIEAIQPRAQAMLAEPLPDDWRGLIKRGIVATMAREAVAIPGALQALQAVSDMRIPWRIASNSSHAEMIAKFSRLGITALVRHRVHSYEDVGIGKPAPDLFLAAAAAEGVAAADCVVVEDSIPGAVAAAAAGMDCLGFDRSTDGAALQAAGAAPFHDMAALPDLIALVAGRAAA